MRKVVKGVGWSGVGWSGWVVVGAGRERGVIPISLVACCGACWRTRVCLCTFRGGALYGSVTLSLSQSLSAGSPNPKDVADSYLTFLRFLLVASSVCPEPHSTLFFRFKHKSMGPTHLCR